MRHNKNKIRPAKPVAPELTVSPKPGHEVFNDEDFTDDEILQSMFENSRHALMEEKEEDSNNKIDKQHS